MDKIIIKGLRVFAYHGVNPEEKEKGQPFLLDITLEADLRAAGGSDDLADTVNYSAVVRTALAAMTAHKWNLIERAASFVAGRILEEFSAVKRVTVLLWKPKAPIAADFDRVAVEIERER